MIKIYTKDLFKQIEFYEMNREQAWDKAVELGWRWDILHGYWTRSND
jgi:hypothetical protein